MMQRMTGGTPIEAPRPGRAGRARRRTRRQTAAVAVSLLVHAVLIGWMAGSAAGSIVSGAAEPDVGGGISVTLVSLAPAAREPQPMASADPLKVLTARLATETPPVYEAPAERPRDRFEALRERVSEASPAPPAPPAPTPPAPPTPPSGKGPPAPTAGAPAAGATVTASANGAAATGGLWGQIEPCWRSAGGRLGVAVSLQVVLNGRGDLAKPPLILRGAAPLDERRLSAEAAALEALSACLPHNDLRFAGGSYRLDFPPT
jgi:hypothetical protein